MLKNLVVGGSRELPSVAFGSLSSLLSGLGSFSVLFHGGCRGCDSLAGRWAAGVGLPVRVFVPDWDRFGRAAGPVRNKKMVSVAGSAAVVVCVFVSGLPCHGTCSLASLALSAGCRVVCVSWSGGSLVPCSPCGVVSAVPVAPPPVQLSLF